MINGIIIEIDCIENKAIIIIIIGFISNENYDNNVRYNIREI